LDFARPMGTVSTYPHTYYKMQTKPPLMDRLKELLFAGEPFAKAVAAVSVSFFAPVWPLLLGMLVMILFDQYTGRHAARKRGEALMPDASLKTVDKFKLYAIGIIGAAVIDWFFFHYLAFLGPFRNPFTMFVSFQIIWAEYQSVVRNIKEVTKTNLNITDVGKTAIRTMWPGAEPDQKQERDPLK